MSHSGTQQHHCQMLPETKRISASRQAQIVELGGLKLLLPLTQSRDVEVQRLAVHALANLSVNGECTIATMCDKYVLHDHACLTHMPIVLVHFLP